jgi:hypothetical protein
MCMDGEYSIKKKRTEKEEEQACMYTQRERVPRKILCVQHSTTPEQRGVHNTLPQATRYDTRHTTHTLSVPSKR